MQLEIRCVHRVGKILVVTHVTRPAGPSMRRDGMKKCALLLFKKILKNWPLSGAFSDHFFLHFQIFISFSLYFPFLFPFTIWFSSQSTYVEEIQAFHLIILNFTQFILFLSSPFLFPSFYTFSFGSKVPNWFSSK